MFSSEAMEDLEAWIDDTEDQLYKQANVSGRRRSSIILSEEFIVLVENIKKEYEMKGRHVIHKTIRRLITFSLTVL